MKVIALAGILLVGAACGAGISGESSGVASPGRTTSPGAASSQPVGQGASPVALRCHLPVATWTGGEGGAPITYRVGFLSLPGTTVAWDPAPPAGPDTSEGWSYAPQLGRWVPAPAESISPDGRRYAYAKFGAYDPVHMSIPTTIHVVDPVAGTDREIVPSGHYQVGGWLPAGILVRPLAQGAPDPGLFLVDPGTGSIRQLDSTHPLERWIVAGGAAWTGDLDKADPNPPAGPGGWNELVRLDPATGAQEVWLKAPGSIVRVLGSAAGGGVIVSTQAPWDGASPGRARVLLVRAAGRQTELWSGTPSTGLAGYMGLDQPFADRLGTWFTAPPESSGSGIWLYTLDGRLQQVTTATGDRGAFFRIAGPCLG